MPIFLRYKKCVDQGDCPIVTGETPAKRVAIFVEASFDYSHFLPEHDRCFPLHGHTSLVSLEISGDVAASGMIMDFEDARKCLESVLSFLDHKLITNMKYATSEGKGNFVISYGNFQFRLPKEHVFLLKGEGTSEEIAVVMAGRLMEAMPANVRSIKLTTTEGLGKGAVVTLERKRMGRLP
jgi:6-pyruvoyl tetrahydropterin synthase/QueD family protein